ncbi:MAG: hypothetical protein ACYTGQ_12490, partial [Planctomycetota bacterium]|jgi:hypothetical protein
MLHDWLMEHPEDETTPQTFRRRILDTQQTHNVDGVVFVHAHLRSLSDLGFGVILGTFTLAWPIVMSMDVDYQIHGVVFDGASGKVVWRSHYKNKLMAQPDDVAPYSVINTDTMNTIFGTLDYAVPEALTKEQGSLDKTETARPAANQQHGLPFQ